MIRTPTSQRTTAYKNRSSYKGINIQWPISRDILSGKKSIETRTYPIPLSYLKEEILLIETPGPQGDFKARIVAIIEFTDCFPYKNPRSFYADYKRHLVDRGSSWKWSDRPKWGWEVKVIQVIDPPIPFPKKKGIVYTKDISLKHS